ncbi:MAG: efflux RND transporter periplasmic adaptor subunit [Schleiferiaceae bacterium]|nr:efflux RND transporter periplasmic adaptor subunit [Schleiferiaceae bacterium]
MKRAPFLRLLRWASPLMVLYMTGLACQTATPEKTKRKPRMPVSVVAQRDMQTYTAFPAVIRGLTNAAIRPKISGYITEVYAEEGSRVKKGNPLFKLETRAIDGNAAAARAAVKAARVEVENLRPLVADSIVSPARLATARAQLEQAQSNLESIEANQGYALLRSPTAGVVGTFPFRQGDLVGRPGQAPLTTISDISSVYAYFSLNEKTFLNWLRRQPGQSRKEKIAQFPGVKLLLPTGETYKYPGKLEMASGQVSTQTGAVRLRARFPNPDGLLTNGNSGSLLLPRLYPQATVIPAMSTFERQGQTFAYRLRGDSLRAQQIKLKDQSERYYILENGLAPGDTFVARGLGKLRSGDAIRAQYIPFDSVATYPVQFR